MKKRLLFGFLCAVLLFIVMTSNDNAFKENIVQKFVPFIELLDDNDVSCYEQTSNNDSLPALESETDPERPIPDKNIFFHETSCFNADGIVLNSRQACAVESAARMNPGMTVYLLFVSPAKISTGSKRIVDLLLTYPNVKIKRIFPNRYIGLTPLEKWYRTGALNKSRWPRSHMSDILRYLTLWKYGGIYLDLDVVVMTSLEKLSNFAGAEDWKNVAAGAMGFGMLDVTGRYVANACIRDLRKNFRGNVWGNNGPGVITRILGRLCSTKYTKNMKPERCRGFNVFPPSTFYPIHYKKWRKYFETQDKNATMKLLEKARAIHVWNKLSKSERIPVDSDVPYAVIARKFCPRVFNNSDKTF